MNDETKQNNISNDKCECGEDCACEECECENSNEEKEPVDELAKIKQERDEYLAGWQRAKADFINYKKQEEERSKNMLSFMNSTLALQALPIADSFDLAEKNLPDELKSDENVKGLLQIRKQIFEFLSGLGIGEIKSVGEKFNPERHEAVELVEENDKESGIIIEEVQKGYASNGSLIRPAKVKVVK